MQEDITSSPAKFVHNPVPTTKDARQEMAPQWAMEQQLLVGNTVTIASGWLVKGHQRQPLL